MLLGAGHKYPDRYPLAMLWTEAEIVRQRVHEQITTQTMGINAVVLQALGGKENRNTLKKFIGTLAPHGDG